MDLILSYDDSRPNPRWHNTSDLTPTRPDARETFSRFQQIVSVGLNVIRWVKTWHLLMFPLSSQMSQKLHERTLDVNKEQEKRSETKADAQNLNFEISPADFIYVYMFPTI